MIKKSNGKYIISAGELGIYVVCPYAWKLRSVLKKKSNNYSDNQVEKGKVLHKKWCKETEDIHVLKTNKSVVLGLLSFIILFSFIFLQDKFLKAYDIKSIKAIKVKSASLIVEILNKIRFEIEGILSLDFDVLMVVALSSITLFTIYIVSVYLKKRELVSGINEKIKILALDNSKILPSKNYVSNMQGLSGKPDAIIKENSHFIPVEIKPLAKKLRDRYIYQLLVYMRLINEFKKRDVPYGYLILGPKAKRVKIYNLPEREKQLTTYLKDMNDILNNKKEAMPSPIKEKCEKCDVGKYCKYNICKIKNKMN